MYSLAAAPSPSPGAPPARVSLSFGNVPDLALFPVPVLSPNLTPSSIEKGGELDSQPRPSPPPPSSPPPPPPRPRPSSSPTRASTRVAPPPSAEPDTRLRQQRTRASCAPLPPQLPLLPPASLTDSAIPAHPVPSMQAAFAESLIEATRDRVLIRPPLREPGIDAKARHERLLEQDGSAPPACATWRYRPGQNQHELWKLTAQISFGVHLMLRDAANSDEQVMRIVQGHVREMDEFLEVAVEDLAYASRDLGERIDLLRVPIESLAEFEALLENRRYRAELADGNERIEHVLGRTRAMLRQLEEDIGQGTRATRDFAAYLSRERDGPWRTERPDIAAIHEAMRDNADGWMNTFGELRGRAAELEDLATRLAGIVNFMASKAGEVSRNNWSAIPPFTSPPPPRPASRTDSTASARSADTNYTGFCIDLAPGERNHSRSSSTALPARPALPVSSVEDAGQEPDTGPAGAIALSPEEEAGEGGERKPDADPVPETIDADGEQQDEDEDDNERDGDGDDGDYEEAQVMEAVERKLPRLTITFNTNLDLSFSFASRLGEDRSNDSSKLATDRSGGGDCPNEQDGDASDSGDDTEREDGGHGGGRSARLSGTQQDRNDVGMARGGEEGSTTPAAKPDPRPDPVTEDLYILQPNTYILQPNTYILQPKTYTPRLPMSAHFPRPEPDVVAAPGGDGPDRTLPLDFPVPPRTPIGPGVADMAGTMPIYSSPEWDDGQDASATTPPARLPKRPSLRHRVKLPECILIPPRPTATADLAATAAPRGREPSTVRPPPPRSGPSPGPTAPSWLQSSRSSVHGNGFRDHHAADSAYGSDMEPRRSVSYGQIRPSPSPYPLSSDPRPAPFSVPGDDFPSPLSIPTLQLRPYSADSQNGQLQQHDQHDQHDQFGHQQDHRPRLQHHQSHQQFHYRHHQRSAPSRVGGMSTLSQVTTTTYDGVPSLSPSSRTIGMGVEIGIRAASAAAGERKLKKKRSAFGWLKKAFSMDEEERAAFEARKRGATDEHFYDAGAAAALSPRAMDGRRMTRQG